jgi:guanosine-3',5'-bis(diphosphate) 3'-pyrophosphohydrolase
MNMATIEKALQIAAKAHEGQKDKSGLPYILHPLRVMMRVEGEEAQIVAVLQDVIEDTSVSAADLRQAGFSEQVVLAFHRGGSNAQQMMRSCGLNDKVQ